MIGHAPAHARRHPSFRWGVGEERMRKPERFTGENGSGVACILLIVDGFDAVRAPLTDRTPRQCKYFVPVEIADNR